MKQKLKVWGQIRVPRPFIMQIKKFIAEHPELGYCSVRELVVAATIDKIEKISKIEDAKGTGVKNYDTDI